jgi:hypothetical protein
MPQIERIISRGQLIPLHFTEDAVAASQTDAQLAIINATGAPANNEYIMPFPGEIIAVTYGLTAAGTAGGFTIGPTIDGTEKTALQQTVGTTAEGRKSVARGSVPFAAGANIGAEITTDGSWDGTTADLVVTVWVLLYLEGI